LAGVLGGVLFAHRGSVFLVGVVVRSCVLLTARASGARVFDRLRGGFGFVAEAAFAFGDFFQLLGVGFERVHAAALVDRLFRFVGQLLEVHGSFQGGDGC
jgi:hypothetical protein